MTVWQGSRADIGANERAGAVAADLFVVIPAYNEARTIVDIVRRILAVAEHVIVVDDGSSDGTGELLRELPVRVLRHETNQGKGASLLDGIRLALDHGADAVVTLDGDAQHAPEYLPRLVERAVGAPDCIVIGARLHDRNAFPPARYRANEIANFWISWAAGYAIDDSQSGFRLYPRAALEVIAAKRRRKHGFAFESEVIIDAAAHGIRSVSVPIPALYPGPTGRPSHFRPVRDILIIVVMVAGKLLRRFMYPIGLITMLRERRARK